MREFAVHAAYARYDKLTSVSSDGPLLTDAPCVLLLPYSYSPFKFVLELYSATANADRLHSIPIPMRRGSTILASIHINITKLFYSIADAFIDRKQITETI